MSMNYKSIIELKSVTFSYSEGPVLFQDLSLVFEQSRFYLIKGRSGTGKSSLLRLINLLEEPSSGKILYKGRPVTSLHSPSLRCLITYIQQTPVVINGSVRDNLLLPFTFKANKEQHPPDDDRLSKLLDDFYLKDVSLESNARNLSVGQHQRLCIIRGLLLSPDVILLDEPTSALDEESSKIVESWTERLCLEYGQTVIMVSHKNFKPKKVIPEVLEVADRHVRKTTWELK